VSSADARGWGPGWPTPRNTDQVKITRAGATSLATWVHRSIAPLVIEGLRRTEDEIRYDVRMLGGYASRPIRGSTSTPSNHSWGLAIDINWDKNPFVKSPLVTDMPAAMVATWKSLGFGWGGDYTSRKDAMHFEFLGTPAQAASLSATLGLHTGSAARAAVAVTSQPAPAPVPESRPLVRLGTNGDAVRLLQERLNSHGAGLGVDGDFGKRTLAAVVAFQRGNGLTPDGIVGGKTWAALG